jgi:hypothetical protein
MNTVEVDLERLPSHLREWVEWELSQGDEKDVHTKLLRKRHVKMDGLNCSGYFSDHEPELVVACYKPTQDWLRILVHETCHRDQWAENSKWWRYKVDGYDPLIWLQEWLDQEIELSGQKLTDVLTGSAMIELDCERRAVEKIKDYELPIDICEYRKKANAYVWFYQAMRYSRRWYAKNKSPYQIREVWEAMPNDFDNDYSKIPRKFKDLMLAHCF